jgi:hypothetical protein
MCVHKTFGKLFFWALYCQFDWTNVPKTLNPSVDVMVSKPGSSKPETFPVILPKPSLGQIERPWVEVCFKIFHQGRWELARFPRVLRTSRDRLSAF